MIGYFEESVQNNLYESYTGDIFNSEFYFKYFSDVFLKFQAYSIHICSVASDNLPCQANAFIPGIYRFPCLA